MLFGLGYLAGIFSKMKSEFVTLKKEACQYLLPITKFELSNENQNFGKILSGKKTLIASQYLDILNEISVTLTNVRFFNITNKCTNIWRAYITQWTK